MYLTNLQALPGDQHCVIMHLPAAVANDATAITAVGKIPFRAQITRAFIIFRANVTGTDTDSRTINVKDSAGNNLFTLAYTLTPPITAVAGVPVSLPLVGTAAQMLVNADAGLQVQSALVGTNGLALPIGQIIVHYKAR